MRRCSCLSLGSNFNVIVSPLFFIENSTPESLGIWNEILWSSKTHTCIFIARDPWRASQRKAPHSSAVYRSRLHSTLSIVACRQPGSLQRLQVTLHLIDPSCPLCASSSRSSKDPPSTNYKLKPSIRCSEDVMGCKPIYRTSLFFIGNQSRF